LDFSFKTGSLIRAGGTLHDEGWLDLGREAVVEVTSEEKRYPVEAALVARRNAGLACR